MNTSLDILCWICAAGALAGAAAYVYGYILKSRGDRRWHTASLLFSGFALANLPIVLRGGAEGPAFINGAVLVAFMLMSMSCQVVIAFRRRRGDRRADDRAVGAAGAAAPAASPVRAKAA